MKIPSRWFPYVVAAAGGAQATGQLRARAERLLEEHEASRARRLTRSLPRRKAAAAEQRARSGATRAVREAVVTRASGRCEACGTETPSALGHLDHFFGRARSELVETCWLLCRTCDTEKTNSLPGRRFWLLRFRRHAEFHGLGRALQLVDQQLALEQAQHPATTETSR